MEFKEAEDLLNGFLEYCKENHRFEPEETIKEHPNECEHDFFLVSRVEETPISDKYKSLVAICKCCSASQDIHSPEQLESLFPGKLVGANKEMNNAHENESNGRPEIVRPVINEHESEIMQTQAEILIASAAQAFIDVTLALEMKTGIPLHEERRKMQVLLYQSQGILHGETFAVTGINNVRRF